MFFTHFAGANELLGFCITETFVAIGLKVLLQQISILKPDI